MIKHSSMANSTKKVEKIQLSICKDMSANKLGQDQKDTSKTRKNKFFFSKKNFIFGNQYFYFPNLKLIILTKNQKKRGER